VNGRAMNRLKKHIGPCLVLLCMALFSAHAHAAISNVGVLDNVLARYAAVASTWSTYITGRATWLFWTLALISMVWTFGLMALRKADIGEFFAEFISFSIFTGFFWWLLINGPVFADAIMRSMRTIAANASGGGTTLSPSGIVDIGFDIFFKVLDKSSVWKPVDSAAGILISIAILIILALIAVNMLLLLISAWVLAYAGVFFLGFGGSRWTSDMAINYYKTVLNIGAQLFTMVLLVGIGKSFIDQYYTNMSAGLSFKELGVMLVVAASMLVLVNKLPAMIGGLAMGGGTHAMGGGFGAGAAMGAAAVAGAAIATGGAAVLAGAASLGGGAQALMAAVSQASQSVAAGSDGVASMVGGMGGSGGSESGGGSSGSGGSPLASAMDGEGSGSSSAQSASGGAGSGGGFGSSGSGDAGSSGGPSQASTQASSGNGAAGGESGSQKSDATPTNASESKGQSDSSSPSQGSAKSTLATAGQIAAGAAANLAKGGFSVGKAKGQALIQAAHERVSQTLGGQIATAIKAQGLNRQTSSAEPTFEGNNLSAANEKSADAESEVAAFRDRGMQSK
jgi:type IV secretion system protein TrbL